MGVIDRINLCLARKGIDGATMSREVGLSNSAYSQWNTGKNQPSKVSIRKLAAYFGVSEEWLMFGDDSENEKVPAALSSEDEELIQLIKMMSPDQKAALKAFLQK